jgi:hypothetical protein
MILCYASRFAFLNVISVSGDGHSGSYCNIPILLERFSQVLYFIVQTLELRRVLV